MIPERMVKCLDGKDFVKWLKKMDSDLKFRDNRRYYAFHNDYGHLSAKCWHLKRKIKTLIKIGYRKELLTSNKNHKENDDQLEPLRNKSNIEKTYDGHLQVIHEEFARGRILWRPKNVMIGMLK